MRQFMSNPFVDQEGLPDYWGIETFNHAKHCSHIPKYQEGLPDYWGIETCNWNMCSSGLS